MRNILLTLYGLVFVASGLMVARGGGVAAGGLLFVAFVLGQCSMVAIWSTGFRGNAAIPCAATTFFSILCWWIIAQFRFVGFGDASAVCWLVVITTQALATMIGATCLDTFSKSSRRKNSDRIVRGVRLRKFSFSIGNLILWTTFVAVGLLVVQLIMVYKGWNADTPSPTQFMFAILVGLCGTAFAVIWLSVFRGAVWSIVAQRSIIWLPVFLFSILFFYIFLVYFKQADFPDPLGSVYLLAGQYCFGGLTLLATLNHTRR